MATKPANTQRIEKYQTMLKCNLTDEELLAYGGEMADKQQQANEFDESLTSIKSEFKSKIEQATARINELAGKLRSKSEHRQVPCERTYDYKAGTVTERRTDTNGTINRREMTADESQMGLPGLPEEPK